MFELILVDPHVEMCDAWREAFAGLDGVTIAQGRFEQVAAYDCVVSAANSYGMMDGGVDLALRDYFGRELERRVQVMIDERWRGEQPVGTSEIVPTGHPDHPWLAHTPTMRVPKRINDTDVPYSATWALLNAVKRHNDERPDEPIRSVLCMGLGTGTGAYPRPQAARLMALAWRLFREPPAAERFARGMGTDLAIKMIRAGHEDPYRGR